MQVTTRPLLLLSRCTQRSRCTVTSEQSGRTRSLIEVPTSVRPLWALSTADFEVGGSVIGSACSLVGSMSDWCVRGDPAVEINPPSECVLQEAAS